MHERLVPLDRIEPDGPGRLRPVAPSLWATIDEPLGDGPARTCGFLLQRDEGNVFVYSCSAFDQHLDHIGELGGIDRIVLNHRDEATRHVTRMADHFGVPVHTHEREVDACHRRDVRDIEPISGDPIEFGPDLIARPTPGHTPGTTSYFWANPHDGRRYVFTGDTFTNFTLDRFPSVLGFHAYDGNVTDMLATLDRLADEPSDVIVPGLFNGPIQAFAWDEDARRAVLDHARGQLQTADLPAT